MYTFIVNPHSRSGLGQHIWNEVSAILDAKQIPYEVFFTKYQKHATKYVAELTSDLKEHTLVVLGGDGTVNEVVSGIADFSFITLGYIPTGSSNDFARGLKLPTSPADALNNILNPGAIKPLDVGVLQCPKKKHYFAVSTGLGFDAAICHQAVVSKLKVFLNKIKLGKLTYVGIALNRLFIDPTVTMKLTIDDQPPLVFDNTYFIAVMNTPYEGGGFKFCPDAKSDDGILDVIVINNLTKKKVLALLPTAFSGNHVKFKGVSIYKGKNISIESSKALAVHTDGEPVFLQKNISVTTAPKQLKIITTNE